MYTGPVYVAGMSGNGMKKWKKKAKPPKRPPETKGLDHRKLPVGQVMTAPIKGEFQGLPLFGWVATRAKTDTPLVMVVLLLMRGTEDPVPRGTLQLEVPIHEDTELATVATLEKLGWDGRVWPGDDGWPEGSDDEEQLQMLMEQASLRASLTFPPGEQGHATLPVNVQRAQGPFLMPPFPEPETPPDQALVDKLRQISKTPGKYFARPMGPAVASS